MALTKGDGGGRGLAAWDKVEKSDPYAIPGTRSYDPERAAKGSGGGRFDIEELVRLTPYAVPSPTATAQREVQAEQNETFGGFDMPAVGSGHKGLWDQFVARQQAEQPRAEEEPKTHQVDALKVEKPKARRTYEMSWEDYSRLSDEQRAAVDFNTLLIQAREKDLNTAYEPAPEQREAYDRAVEDMFGEQGSSATFAPETVAVLQQIDFAANGESLDDFLSLKTTISERELKGFSTAPVETPVQIAGGSVPLGPVQVGEAQAADRTAELQAAMAKSNELIQSFKASAALARNDTVAAFGGTPNEVKTAPGFGAPSTGEGEATIDDFFQWAFNDLTLKNVDPQTTWTTIDETLKPGEKKAFIRFLDSKTRQVDDFDLDLGDGNDQKLRRTPTELRVLAGLDKGDD